jgi:uncharacterized linocin/CFP29 family protein
MARRHCYGSCRLLEVPPDGTASWKKSGQSKGRLRRKARFAVEQLPGRAGSGRKLHHQIQCKQAPGGRIALDAERHNAGNDREETMDVLGRDTAPFSGRVWQQIDAAVGAVKAANLTARRFLEVDGPYGLGLTTVSGDDNWLEPAAAGPASQDWGVARARQNPPLAAFPDAQFAGPAIGTGQRGTSIVHSAARPVAMVTSEFLLGVRNVEAFDDECQPLDLLHATRAARDVALEEERLLYYGNLGQGYPGLLRPAQQIGNQSSPLELIQQPGLVPGGAAAQIGAMGLAAFALQATQAATAQLVVFQNDLRLAIQELAARGFVGPYALAVNRVVYTALYNLIPGGDSPLADLLRELFVMGVHLVPVIQPDPAANAAHVRRGLGVIVTCSRPYVRLVIGQDWTTAYRGTDGVYHRFLIVSSLRLEITEPRAIQVLLL